jgi:hypothetical protein
MREMVPLNHETCEMEIYSCHHGGVFQRKERGLMLTRQTKFLY